MKRMTITRNTKKNEEPTTKHMGGKTSVEPKTRKAVEDDSNADSEDDDEQEREDDDNDYDSDASVYQSHDGRDQLSGSNPKIEPVGQDDHDDDDDDEDPSMSSSQNDENDLSHVRPPLRKQASGPKKGQPADERPTQSQEEDKADQVGGKVSKPKKTTKPANNVVEESSSAKPDTKPKSKASSKQKPSSTETKPKKPTQLTKDEMEAKQALLNEWNGQDKAQDDASDVDTDEEDDSDADDRAVDLEDGYLDHIVLAVSNLKEGMNQFARMTGITPRVYGTIKGIGVRSARVSFTNEKSCFLEIVAPNTKERGPIGDLIKAKGITDLAPFGYAIRTSRAEELASDLQGKKFKYISDHLTMIGGKNVGKPQTWDTLHLYGHNLGGLCPYLIEWPA
jgi:Glyoxalase-like domain